MKIPLKPNKKSPFPKSLSTSKSVGIDFESGPLKLHKPGYRSGSSAEIGGFSGVVSGVSSGVSNTANGSNGGSGGGGENEDPDQLSYWLSVDLATSP
jgi:hypothetical protein